MLIKKAAAILAVAMGLSSVAASARTLEFTIGSPEMYVDDVSVTKTELDCKPYTSNDRTMVPVRVISENFGADVKWDDAERRVDITKGDTKLTLHIGSYEATVNGEAKTLDVAPELTDSRTMVPLRFISEALGKRVEYVESTEQVIISDEDYAITIGDFSLSADDIKFYIFSQGMGISSEALSANFDSVKNELIKNVVLSELAKEKGVSLSEEDVKSVADTFWSSKDSVYESGCLVAPGIKLYNELLYAQKLSLYDLYPDAEEIEKIYAEKFIKVKHILLKKFDSATALYYDEEKKAEVKKNCENILKRIKKGEDFEALREEFNEDDEAFFFPDGMIISYDSIIKDFADVAFNLKENEMSDVVETKLGFHIIKRYPLPELDEKAIKEISSDLINMKTAEIAANTQITYHMTDEEIISEILNEN